jgi:hypothetical protein
MHRASILAEGTPGEIRSPFATLEEAMIRRIEETDGETARDGFGSGSGEAEAAER